MKKFNLLASTLTLATLTLTAAVQAPAMVVASSPLTTVARQAVHGLAGRGVDWTGGAFSVIALETPAGQEWGVFNYTTPEGDTYGGALNSVYIENHSVYAAGVVTYADDALSGLIGSGFAFRATDNRDIGPNAPDMRSKFLFDPGGPTDGYTEDPALRAAIDAGPMYRFISGQMIVLN